MLEPTDGDWLVRLRSLGDVDRRALITIALYNVMDDLVKCIDDAVKCGGLGSTFKSKLPSFSMGLGKVIAWGILAFILTGFLALVVAGLVYGALTSWSLNGGKPPMGSVYVGIVLLILADTWVIRKLRIAYAQYRRQKMWGRLS